MYNIWCSVWSSVVVFFLNYMDVFYKNALKRFGENMESIFPYEHELQGQPNGGRR